MEKISYGAGIFAIKEFLAVEECDYYIGLSNRVGYEEAAIQTANGQQIFKAIRNNDRVILDDEGLAQRLFEKAEPCLSDLEEWSLLGFNERLRFYRYTPGQYFKWHKDGFYCRNEDETSQLSFLIYLNDDYEGGEIDFRWEKIKPEKGMALVFPHLLMHQGAPVESGVKYVLRTDVMFRRIEVSG
ncbi:iron-regulated protein [Hahella sp. CCB-MM4]|uniref:prolyl hydroxylase family protein n=1 Tax=Hahella sp. (strain CCB-MM4) TaxID=1926491 RepID=UPI000B9C58C5|nr:2OG-Fe(II) oxygenase [Hahella sp. CCB-MM4]OZG74548.1 iron-regulated protein [Hahella sp. CCB-MM4]